MIIAKLGRVPKKLGRVRVHQKYTEFTEYRVQPSTRCIPKPDHIILQDYSLTVHRKANKVQYIGPLMVKFFKLKYSLVQELQPIFISNSRKNYPRDTFGPPFKY